MEEFKEIANCGGIIQLLYDEKTSEVSLQYSHHTPTPASLFQLGVALDGSKMEYWPIHGMGVPKPEPVMVPVLVGSDREGLYGRSCPSCRSYFRSDFIAEPITCPYCAHQDNNPAFTTTNQILFINKVRECWLEAFEEKKNVTINLDEIAVRLPENRPTWTPTDKVQQNKYHCAGCNNVYDILGEYAGCPQCGKRNSLQVIEGNLIEIEEQFQKADEEVTDRQDREVEWEKMTRCVSEFEAMARDIQGQLALLPATPRRKNQIKSLSFHQILRASECLLEWVGIELLKGFTELDKKFLNIMFNRRHILTHNAGKVDQEYLDKSGDKQVQLNYKISVRSNEIKRLIPLLRKCSHNLYEGYESIA